MSLLRFAPRRRARRARHSPVPSALTEERARGAGDIAEGACGYHRRGAQSHGRRGGDLLGAGYVGAVEAGARVAGGLLAEVSESAQGEQSRVCDAGCAGD